MNIKDKLQEIEERSWDYDFPYVGEPLKKELLDIWNYLHKQEKDILSNSARIKNELIELWYQLHLLEGPYANCSHPLDKIQITNGADEPSICGQCGARLTYKKQDNGMYKWQVESLHEQYKSEPILRVKLLHSDAKVPTRGSDEAIGWDLYALVARDTSSSISSLQYIEAHQRITIPTGIAVAIPHGYYGRIAPRSGLAHKHGVDILAGVIDSDYRGEVKVILHNTSANPILVDLGNPIAQLILERADQGRLIVVDKLDNTVRGDGGFGSMDTKGGGV